MKMLPLIKWLIGLVTLACGLAAFYSWHLREVQIASDAAASAAVQYEKRVQGHSRIYKLILRSMHNNPKLSTFVNELPGKKSYQKVKLTKRITDQDLENRIPGKATFKFKLKDKTFVEFRIVSGYFRDHLDPHVFEFRYTDTPNNNAAIAFVQNSFRAEYKFTEGIPYTFENKIVESLQ